jgi:hypothetical protein
MLGGKLQSLAEKQKVCTDWNGSAVPIRTHFLLLRKGLELASEICLESRS